jgi:S1-C subfamily serine protease
VLQQNARLQLALLKIDAETPEYFELSAEPVARKGDWILAINNAFKVADGPEPLSVNLGVISLRTRLQLRRGVQDFSYDGDVLLIDAITSNPGAAGGAVVTADQRLAGMIGKVIESTSTNTRLNYAVPSDLLAQFVVGKLADEPVASVARGKAVPQGPGVHRPRPARQPCRPSQTPLRRPDRLAGRTSGARRRRLRADRGDAPTRPGSHRRGKAGKSARDRAAHAGCGTREVDAID